MTDRERQLREENARLKRQPADKTEEVTILDLCTRKVIGWSTRTRIGAELACTALRAALAQRGEPSGVIMHAGRGSVYCGRDHRNLIRRYRLVATMSGHG